MTKHSISDFFEDNYLRFKGYLKLRFRELNEYDIEDIIQQTIMKLLYKGDDLFSVQNLTAYMYSSLQNGAKDYYRNSSRKDISEEDSRYKGLEGDNLENQVLNEELKQMLKNALDSLDDKTRYVFVETEIKGRSYESLVEETGEKLGTLLSRKNRGKKRLQELLKEYSGRK